MNWKERYATEKDAGRIRKTLIKTVLNHVPGVSKGTAKGLAEGAETLLGGGSIGEAIGAGVEELGPIGRAVSKGLQDPDVQETVTRGVHRIKNRLKGPSPTVTAPSAPSYDPEENIGI